MKENIKKTIYLILTAASFLLPWLWSPCRNFAPGLAVLAGIIFSVCWGNPFSKITGRITSNLLGATIVGMGFGMNLMEVLKAGGSGFIYTFIGIAAGLFIGVFIGKLLKIDKNIMYLVSTGTSICGGSAIAAAAPALKARADDIAMASATVFALNAVALWVFPPVGHLLGFSEAEFGYWAALGIHDTSSVVGASMQYGPEALEIGTKVKLARALWIVPVTVYLSMFVAEKETDGKRKIRFRIPWFIPCFIAASALVTWVPVLESAGGWLKDISKYLMITTLFLIGSNLSREKLKSLGLKPVIMGVILWIILSTAWCAAIACGLVKCTV